MATTINAYSVSLGLDASSFIDSAKLTRSETRQLVKDIEAAQTPFEKFAVEQTRLKKALDDGAISQATYNRILESKRPAVDQANASMHPYIASITALTAGYVAAGAAMVAFIAHMRSVQGTIDETADKATRLGISFSDLRSLEFGFAEGAGIDAQTVSDSIKKLQINLAKAVQGDEGLRKAFGQLGVDAGEMIGMGPKQAMLEIADAMAGVSNHADRLRLSMEIFGKSGADLASTLGEGSDALGSSVEFADRWLGLTEQQVAMIGTNNDAWDRISIVVEGITQKVAAELAPVMELVATEILGMAEGMTGIDEMIRSAVDATVEWAGFLADASGNVRSIAERLVGIVSIPDMDLEGVIAGTPAAASTAETWMMALDKKREQARIDADKRQAARDIGRAAAEMLDTEAVINKREAAAQKLADDEKRMREAAEREANKKAEDALKAAERYFEDERKRQMKMREDVARGPGAGMEAGSAEAARFMAQQANAAIAESVVGVDAKPTDQQLAAYSKILVDKAIAKEIRDREMVAAIRGVTTAVEQNGFEAVR